MPRPIHKLTAQFCMKTTKPGSYRDGGGLIFNVSPTGSKYWAMSFIDPVAGKKRQMGLGSYPTVTLSMAREKLLEAKRRLSEGKSPSASATRTATPSVSTTVPSIRWPPNG